MPPKKSKPVPVLKSVQASKSSQALKSIQTPKPSETLKSPNSSKSPKDSKLLNSSKEPNTSRQRKNRSAPKASKAPTRWSMSPSLHPEVSDLLREHGLVYQFHSEDDDLNCLREYDTTVMGLFVCRKRACAAHGWSSKQIPTTIREYPNKEYNARVYHQRCKSCETLCKPKLDYSYAERVAYRIKRWNGVRLQRPPYSGKSKRPHRSDLCEGCKEGHCGGLILEDYVGY